METATSRPSLINFTVLTRALRGLGVQSSSWYDYLEHSTEADGNSQARLDKKAKALAHIQSFLPSYWKTFDWFGGEREGLGRGVKAFRAGGHTTHLYNLPSNDPKPTSQLPGAVMSIRSR